MTTQTPHTAGDDGELSLEYEGRYIDVEYFDDDTALMSAVKRVGIIPKYESVAYCNTYEDIENPKWGKIYLLRTLDFDSIAHECVHLASGIMARQGQISLEFTAGDASDLEEKFCGLVGNLSGLIAESAIQSHTAKAALEARIEEREHTWKLINDIRYQHVSLDFAKSVSLERLSNAQVDQQLEAEAALKQGPTNAK